MLIYQSNKGDTPLTTPIHPTAVIHPKAELHPTVEVGPYAVIGDKVKIDAQTTIGPHAVIEGPTEIGVGNRIFPSAVIGLEPQDLKYKGAASQVKIGDYNTFREFVTINRATHDDEVTQIGNHNLLMAYVHVAHNGVIEDNVIIANAVALAGHVHIESRAVIGGVLGIHQFVRIGRNAMLGGMSRIDRDAPPFMMVEGNPSRVRSLNLVGLKRSGLTSEDINLLKQAFRLLYVSKITFKEALAQLETLSDNEYVQYLYQFLQSSTTGEKRRGLIPGKV
ncbi:acyl-ACP--UDP-N-acetylglucosamine O-acyltransferase [Aphanothece sacrum]|uniref:Acyl-[acyl-carrier-protein]--UDP-N-acetylglucosamine O-acyltransferase n=1 Tax=Aphanothece sacrum FPU1 TaxID=1920663 RepID=A0A401IK22_APHSA|nr:acyl-ACP--UDP-N-acetylglucosamine O-acyltransferase [Aphanothece sacrum]GBF81566.1 acyl-carrier-protein--UDP-N-acetylglucosamine O-acyltransferase [Aphanothece sacrum FPU1]GBF86977.1 LpxA protein [Aphanothece sacrum FPU3]